MPRILIPQKNLTLKGDSTTSLMNNLLTAGLPVASSCGGDGICGKCRVKVLHHPENLSPESELETRRKKELNIPSNERLSCQTQLHGDITIEAPYW